MKITIDAEAGKAYVYTPYNAEFVGKIRNVGGAKWDSDKRAWTVPAETVQEVRQIMRAVYGEDDLPSGGKSVSVRLTFERGYSTLCRPVTLMGKTVAVAYGRDTGAKVGTDVVFLEGEPDSGGSAKNWRTVIPAGAVVVLKNVPESKAKEEMPNGVIAEIIEESGPDKAALLEEKARLEKRLAEINEILGGA